MRKHMMDLPAPVDDVHLLCGEVLGAKSNRHEHVTGTPELVNCIPCLRAFIAKQRCEIAALQNKVDMLTGKQERSEDLPPFPGAPVP